MKPFVQAGYDQIYARSIAAFTSHSGYFCGHYFQGLVFPFSGSDSDGSLCWNHCFSKSGQ